MIHIIPAIDLIDGQNVRLTKGDYQSKTMMKRTPAEAIQFYSQFEQVCRIHVVDLMGALKQEAVETSLITELKKQTQLPLQIGGGLRNKETIAKYDAAGIDYFIIGTRAITDIEWLKEVVSEYPNRIIVGMDAKEEDIYINGWTENSGITITDYLTQVESLELAGIIYTDINKDGMNQGPNFDKTAYINQLTRHIVIASGGIRDKADLNRLDKEGITQAVVGKASHQAAFWEGIQ